MLEISTAITIAGKFDSRDRFIRVPATGTPDAWFSRGQTFDFSVDSVGNIAWRYRNGPLTILKSVGSTIPPAITNSSVGLRF